MRKRKLKEVVVNGYRLKTAHPEAITPYEWKTTLDRTTGVPYFVREVAEDTPEDDCFRHWKPSRKEGTVYSHVGMLEAWHVDGQWLGEHTVFWLLKSVPMQFSIDIRYGQGRSLTLDVRDVGVLACRWTLDAGEDYIPFLRIADSANPKRLEDVIGHRMKDDWVGKRIGFKNGNITDYRRANLYVID